MGVTVSAVIHLVATYEATLDLGDKKTAQVFDSPFNWASGTGLDQADMVWGDKRTLAASATEDLDFAAVLTDLLTGAAMTFAKIKAIAVKAASGNTNAVQVTRPAVNGVPLFMAAGDGISLAPNDAFVWMGGAAAGKTVTASTGDLLTFTNSAGSTSVTYTILVIGTSA